MAEIFQLNTRRPLEDEAVDIIDFLNDRTGQRFRKRRPDGSLSHSSTMVLRLLKDGYAVEDIRSVIAMKIREWGGHGCMRKYLRPKTLFGPENFEGYEGQLR